MNTKINDGGPAFPITINGRLETDCATTLRDYFAAKALQMIVVNDVSGKPDNFREYYCKGAYEWADAMLKAREEASL